MRRVEPSSSRRPRRLRRCGITLIEASICVVIVGVMFVAAMQAASYAAVVRFHSVDRGQARLLASSLMAEILQQFYSDPGAMVLFGPELSETQRKDFDDVDDFHNYTDSPPVYRDGTAVAGAAGLRRRVTVVWVDPADPRKVVSFNSGAKRITVQVTRNQVPLATRVAVRTNAP